MDFYFEPKLELEVFDYSEKRIVVENFDRVVDMVDIEHIFHRDFSTLDSKVVVEPKAAMAQLNSNSLVNIVKMVGN